MSGLLLEICSLLPFRVNPVSASAALALASYVKETMAEFSVASSWMRLIPPNLPKVVSRSCFGVSCCMLWAMMCHARELGFGVVRFAFRLCPVLSLFCGSRTGGGVWSGFPSWVVGVLLRVLCYMRLSLGMWGRVARRAPLGFSP